VLDCVARKIHNFSAHRFSLIFFSGVFGVSRDTNNTLFSLTGGVISSDGGGKAASYPQVSRVIHRLSTGYPQVIHKQNLVEE